ncbi:MAG: hypothetical protein VW580_04900 [Flavobacteriaceae bacterium]
MANEYVKEWHYEGSFKFVLKGSSVEKLAKLGTPPQDAECVVDQEDLRFMKSTVKEVNAHANKVPGVDSKDRGKGKVSKKSSEQNNKSQK